MAGYERASTYIASNTAAVWDIADSTEVIIVGSSITSLTLAVDLARRGIGFVLLKTNITRSSDVSAISIPENEIPISNSTGENFGEFGLQPRSLEIYEDLGVIDSIMAKATPLRGERMIIDGRVALDWNYDSSTCDSYYKLPVTIEQCEIERILLNRLIELGCGNNIKGPIEVISVTEEGPKVWLRYRAVTQLTDVFLNSLETPHSTPSQFLTFDTAPTSEKFISGKFLVGCDGTNSSVRRLLEIPYPGCAVDTARFVIADVVMDWGIAPDCDKVTSLYAHGYATVAMHLKDNIWRLIIIAHNSPLSTTSGNVEGADSDRSTRSGATSSVRSPDTPPMRPGQVAGDADSTADGSASSRSRSVWQHTSTCSVGENEELPPPTREDISFLIQRVLPDAACSELIWCSWTPIISRCCPRFNKSRAFLAGDAAHVTPPVFMQGLNTGIQDAHNLAWKMAQVVKEGAPLSLLETYTEERQPVNYHIRLFSTLPGRQVAEGKLWIIWVFKNLLPHALDVKTINQVMSRKLSQLGIGYRKGALVGSRSSGMSGLGPGTRCPDSFISCLGNTDVAFTRLHKVLQGPQHTLMTLLNLPTLADTLANLRATAGKKGINDTRLMELLLDDVMAFMSEMTNLLKPKSRQSSGGVRNVLILTSGKAVATPQLPAITGLETNDERIAEYLKDPSKHAALFTSYVRERFLAMTKGTTSVAPDGDLFLGWDSDCELTNQFNWGLSPQPRVSFQSVMQTLGSLTKTDVTKELIDGTADQNDVLDAVTHRFGTKYGGFALIRPDGHVSHTGYISDLAARRETTKFAQEYLCSSDAM